MLKNIKNNELTSALSEVLRLSNLIMSIPMSSASAERSFSTLKRMKNYLRNSMGQTRLTGLAIISIEKRLLSQLRNQPDFYNKIINIFCQKNRRLEFVYRI